MEDGISQTKRLHLTQKKQCRALRKRTNACQDLLTSSLPREVISNIFVKCMEHPEPVRVPWCDEDDDAFWNEEYQWIPPVKQGRKDILYAPLQLGSICQSWRQIAWSTPQLWNTIAIDIGNKKLSRKHSELLDACLDRSRTLPLRINLAADEIQDSSSHLVKTAPIKMILNTVLAHSKKWLHLDVTLPYSIAILLRIDANARPKLRRLKLNILRTSRLPAKKVAIHADWTYLTHVTLGGMKLQNIDIEWSNLTHLDTSDLSGGDCLEMLLRARKLTNFAITTMGQGTRSGGRRTLSSVKHDSLKFFELWDFENCGSFFLGKLSLPNLEEFRFFKMEAEERIEFKLNEIMVQSFTASLTGLKRLVLQDDLYHRCRDIIKVLQELPLVNYLELKIVFWAGCRDETDPNFPEHADINPFLIHLADSDRHLDFLPNLEELYIHGTPELSWRRIPPVFGLTGAKVSRRAQQHTPQRQHTEICRRGNLRSFRLDFELLYWPPPPLADADALTFLSLLEQNIALTIGSGPHPGDVLRGAIKRLSKSLPNSGLNVTTQ